MLDEYRLQTDTEGFTDITGLAEKSVAKSGIKDGICVVYCPHTTAGITINENADPDVVHDILLGLSALCRTARTSAMPRAIRPRI